MEPLNTQNSSLGEGMKSQYMWIVAAVVVIVLIFAGYKMFSKNDSSDTNTSAYTQEELAENMSEATGDLEVENQLPGDVVYISSVSLSQQGFVVISVAKGSGEGKVIGSKLFGEGRNPGQIVVSERTKEGQTYAASLYVDDGDGIFDAKKDRFLVVKNFRATQYLDYIKG